MLTTLQVHTMKPEIQFSQRNTPSIHLQEPQLLLNLLGLRPGPQYQSPVRSKQRASSTEDPQPKKKQKSASAPEPRVPTTERFGRPLPIISEIPPEGFNSDDSDYDAASGAASTHDHPDTDINYRITSPPNTASTTPPWQALQRLP